jgi:hypothetical protein
MEDNSEENNNADPRSHQPSGATEARTRKKKNKTSTHTKKANGRKDSISKMRKSWRTSGPIRKLEIILLAIVAAGGVGYLVAYISVSIWQQRAWIDVRDVRMTEFSVDKGFRVSATAVNVGKVVATIRFKYTPLTMIPTKGDTITSQDISKFIHSDEWVHHRVFGPLPILPGGTWCIAGHYDATDAKAWVDAVMSREQSGFKNSPEGILVMSDPLRAIMWNVKLKKVFAVFIGEITYGQSKETGFCGVYLPDQGVMQSCPPGYDYAN